MRISDLSAYVFSSDLEQELPTAIPGVATGTPDARRVVGPNGYIWDLKYGYGIVEVRDWWQGFTYAVNLFAKHEWNLTHINVTLVQPSPYHPISRATGLERGGQNVLISGVTVTI